MPGAVPITSTAALTNATARYTLQLANMGWKAACKANPGLALGVNMVEGKITNEAVAQAFNTNYVPLNAVLS